MATISSKRASPQYKQQYMADCHCTRKDAGPWTQGECFRRTCTISGSKGSCRHSSDSIACIKPLTTKFGKGTLQTLVPECFLMERTVLKSLSTIAKEAVSLARARIKRQKSPSEANQGSTPCLVQKDENSDQTLSQFDEGKAEIDVNSVA